MYDEIAPSYNALHGEEQRLKLAALMEGLDLDNVSTVLDVGCGTAHLAPYFSDKLYLGIDPSQPLLDHAPAGTTVLCAPGESLPVEDASYDLVLSLTALHNYDDPLQGVDELFRVASKFIAVGVLKRSAQHDAIVERLESLGEVFYSPSNQHDTLLLLRKP